MFGQFGGAKNARDKAIKTITENLKLQLSGYIKFANLAEVIKNDAYIAGYISGKLMSFIAYFIKAEGMPAEDANMVSGMVLLNLFGENQARIVSQAIKANSSSETLQYIDGRNRGARIVTYAVGAQDVRKDSDYVRAIATFRKMEGKVGSRSESNNHWAAITGLEQLWIGDRLAKYLKHA